MFQPKADHHCSEIPFCDFRWIGPSLVEKVLPNRIYLVRKLNNNQTQILHQIRLRKYNPETPPEDNSQEAQWQVDDNIVVPQDDLLTLEKKVEFGGRLFDITIIYTDLNAIDFDEVTHKDRILLLSRSPIFMIQALVKTKELASLLTHL